MSVSSNLRLCRRDVRKGCAFPSAVKGKGFAPVSFIFSSIAGEARKEYRWLERQSLFTHHCGKAAQNKQIWNM
jgi:hypothetical protein